jgi:hypothetical protein
MIKVHGTRVAQSIIAIGALLSMTSGLAFAGDDVTADRARTSTKAVDPESFHDTGGGPGRHSSGGTFRRDP